MKYNNKIYYNLLATCSTPELSEDSSASIRELTSEVKDWSTLIKLAEIYRSKPMLCNRLFCSNVVDIPLSIQQELKDAELANIARSVIMTHCLADIMDTLNSEGIRTLTYKGPVLANEAYDNPSLRLFDDLDIIVDKKHILQAKQAIERLGYAEIVRLPENIENSPFRPSKPYTLRSKDGSHEIDLSSRLTHDYFSFEIPKKELWGHSRKIEIDGRIIRTISKEALILYLCVHGSKHLWSRPSWISDIAGLLIRFSDEINWDKTITLARSTDGLRMLLLGISLAEKEYGEKIPTQIKECLSKDSAMESLCNEVYANLRINAGRPECDNLNRLRFHLRLRQKLHSRLRYIILRAVTPSYNDWRRLKLPCILYPLYYLTRPFRLTLSALRKTI